MSDTFTEACFLILEAVARLTCIKMGIFYHSVCISQILIYVVCCKLFLFDLSTWCCTVEQFFRRCKQHLYLMLGTYLLWVMGRPVQVGGKAKVLCIAFVDKVQTTWAFFFFNRRCDAFWDVWGIAAPITITSWFSAALCFIHGSIIFWQKLGTKFSLSSSICIG